MSDNSVVGKIKELRKDLDKETNFLQQQMELPLNGNVKRNIQTENNSIQLSKGIAISKWVRKITSQFESVDPFYK
tara:strand:- start:396 stop:620 length:225 start_codon:yes stop_codon:yes gene_type:complete